jgi:hypothetical protein
MGEYRKGASKRIEAGFQGPHLARRISMNEQSTLIHLYFGKQEDEIAIETLGISLLETANQIERISRAHNEDVNVRVIVKPCEPGSFDVPIEIQVMVAVALFDPNIREHLIALAKMLPEFLNIKKFLKGVAPHEVINKGDSAIIVNGDNNRIEVDRRTMNLYLGDPELRKSVSKQFNQ